MYYKTVWTPVYSRAVKVLKLSSSHIIATVWDKSED